MRWVSTDKCLSADVSSADYIVWNGSWSAGEYTPVSTDTTGGLRMETDTDKDKEKEKESSSLIYSGISMMQLHNLTYLTLLTLLHFSRNTHHSATWPSLFPTQASLSQNDVMTKYIITDRLPGNQGRLILKSGTVISEVSSPMRLLYKLIWEITAKTTKHSCVFDRT